MASSQEPIIQLRLLLQQTDNSLQNTLEHMHQGYPCETLTLFLIARDWNVAKSYKMLIDCLNWRIKNEIDIILAKPITPTDLYRAVRDSQLIGMSGYSDQGLPIIAIGVGLSTFDKTSVHYYVQSHIQINEYRDRVIMPIATKKYGRHIGTCVKVLDMSGLKLSSLSLINLWTTISNIDDLYYPEKTDAYYIVNAPYVFSACWKVVKPLIQERTKKKVHVLQGSGKKELLKIMDHASLPHFCHREEVSRRGTVTSAPKDDCFSLDHPFHQQLYNHAKTQSELLKSPLKQMTLFDVNVAPENEEIARSISFEVHKDEGQNGFPNSII